MAVAVTPIPDGPPVPDSSVEEPIFDVQFENFLEWLKDDFRPSANALADVTNANAVISENARATAVQAAGAASDAAEAAAGAANFKGMWPSLSGPLNKPASVKHNNRIWLLLNNLANVAASEPGVSADWTTGDSGTIVQMVSADTAAVSGPIYCAVTVGITVAAPVSRQAGDTFRVRNCTPGIIYVAWSGATVKNETPDSPMAIPAFAGLDATFTGGTYA